MAKKVFKDPFIDVGGTDLSDHISQITLSYSADTPEATASGDDTSVMLPNGLKSYEVSVTFRQDFAASSVDATLFSLVGTSVGTVEIRPSQAAVGSTNPSYTGDMILQDYSPVDGSIGDTHDASATFVPDATGASPDLTRATS